MGKRSTIIVSDIHGCLEEFEELLKVISYNPETIRLVLGGDVMDRGPYPVECLRRVQELKLECVLANHEDWHLRWRKHSMIEKLTGKKNPMPPKGQKRTSENERLNDQDLKWLGELPTKINLHDNWWLVHAGLEPNKLLKDQDKDQLIRCRYINEKGNAVALIKKMQPPNSTYWAKLWPGPESIIFGHNVFDKPAIFQNQKSVCIGIDTGCVFGQTLTACLLDGDKYEFVSVKAKQVYKKL